MRLSLEGLREADVAELAEAGAVVPVLFTINTISRRRLSDANLKPLRSLVLAMST